MDKRLNEETVLTTSGNVSYLKFDALEKIPFIRHGFSTKLGGVSGGVFASMNLGFDRGDDNENVMENYRRIAKAIGFDTHDLVFLDQWHTTNIRVAQPKDRGKGIYLEKDYESVDGHITDEEDIVLLAFGADCPSIFLVDTESRAIGLCHSGWKGTLARIAQKTLNAMKNQYGTRPENIVALVGPSICGDCYEVEENVATPFSEEFKCEIASFPRIVMPGKSKGKFQLDLWEANRAILKSAGVLTENIHVSGVCTMENPDLLFSHRRDGSARGSMAAFLMIRGD
ncbi:MAG: peptidoglycan editing factor PgeF [Lachnospiraceae bacterium]|nr:peptidoglycan editing factor PgeF [Lachnospiraceae bacterium]